MLELNMMFALEGGAQINLITNGGHRLRINTLYPDDCGGMWSGRAEIVQPVGADHVELHIWNQRHIANHEPDEIYTLASWGDDDEDSAEGA